MARIWVLKEWMYLDSIRLPTPVFLPEKSHEQRSLADYSLKGRKESDMTEHRD